MIVPPGRRRILQCEDHGLLERVHATSDQHENFLLITSSFQRPNRISSSGQRREGTIGARPIGLVQLSRPSIRSIHCDEEVRRSLPLLTRTASERVDRKSGEYQDEQNVGNQEARTSSEADHELSPC